jgi:hypothetical protein
MSGFYVLDVPEFQPMVDVVRRNERCRIHDVAGGYWFIEFSGEIEIVRAETGLGLAVWFGCLTAGLDGKIKEFDGRVLRLAPTNEPIMGA